ncbi:hypothetical protein ACO22_06998 [Paracoccidioides brasiliensis]|uniref:PNPLA domain-containing protein n=1 Tax=Paracoccidioides brasiliensis TaxID=121759 RepID=A0A1D2J5W6_PARBR|nr:hypothetical protein ACO22_06998 [Paracoccidioides brasiliensis]
MDSFNNIRRKDTTKGPPLRVLSLDGGGVRGYSMLILLQELMHRTYVECEGKAPSRDQIPKPCDHFDLIAGTGTGGLIALMLGRLCLDLETCKEVYVRMTRRVFETDKTIAGIPYRSTLFKASKLEEAIRQCVWEHTVSESEGKDGSSLPPRIVSSHGSHGRPQSSQNLQRRFSRASVGTGGALAISSPVGSRASMGVMNGSRSGNSDAMLYDRRENRTKTAVAAVYKGTPWDGSATLLRSYDSRKEPAPEFNCTIWQAGRATCATGLAFKPIQVGQHVFVDEGAGKYNPSPLVLDEAVVNEWPGREVGIFVSVGTGKQPAGTSHIPHEWWEDVSDSLGTFAEARRRLIAKIEGCEKTHQYMLKEHLAKRNVPRENYVRLNVEVGVGEFGMNEWHRLAEISTSTRTYLSRSDVQKMNQDAAVKLAKVHFMHRRQGGSGEEGLGPIADSSSFEEGREDGEMFQRQYRPVPPVPPSLQARPRQPSTIELPDAVELPGEDFIPVSSVNNTNNNPQPLPPPNLLPRFRQLSRTTSQDKFTIPTSDEYPHQLNFNRKPALHSTNANPSTPTQTHAPTPPFSPQCRLNADRDNQPPPPNRPDSSHTKPSPRRSSEMFINQTQPGPALQPYQYNRSHTPPLSPLSTQPQPPPPLPPKTPIPYPDETGNGSVNGPLMMPISPREVNRPSSSYYGSGGDLRNGSGVVVVKLPYPSDGPPPLVNKGRKPVFSRRSR